MEIKNINDGINWRTIPKVIQTEFAKNGHIREETHKRNDKGSMDVTYGEIMNPIFGKFSYDELNFFVNDKYLWSFYEYLDKKRCYDEDLNNITRKEAKPFLTEYSKGFNKGYNEFENTLKKDSPLFGTSNEHIVYKVYSRIIHEKKGSFPMYVSIDSNQTDLEKRILKENGIQFLYKLNKEMFFNSGFQGGEFYKAWEIILNNPTVFEPIFTKNSEVKPNQLQQLEPEPEPFDLSDTSAVEKIIYLNELGIIDFLRTKTEFIGSTNLMATVLSAITDVKASTLQTSLNRLINNDTADKNHPYRTQKTVDKVRQTFIDKNIKLKAS